MATIEELLSEARRIRSEFKHARDAEIKKKLQARYRDIDRQLADLRKSQAGLPALDESRRDSEGSNSTESNSYGEIEIYSDKVIRVTSARIIVGNKTYALRNVTSVSMKEDPPEDNTATLRGCGCLLIGLGVLIFMMASSGGVAVMFLMAFALAVPGVWLLNIENTAKPTYSLVISSSSGEVQALTSPDRGQIEKPLASINDAIVRYL